MYNWPPAYRQREEFAAQVARLAERLAPDVVEMRLSVGDDPFTGNPSAEFLVVLADDATTKERLGPAGDKVRDAIWDELEPMERWGVFPFIRFRSKSEQEGFSRLAA